MINIIKYAIKFKKISNETKAEAKIEYENGSQIFNEESIIEESIKKE